MPQINLPIIFNNVALSLYDIVGVYVDCDVCTYCCNAKDVMHSGPALTVMYGGCPCEDMSQAKLSIVVFSVPYQPFQVWPAGTSAHLKVELNAAVYGM